jgi:hypothetical protein
MHTYKSHESCPCVVVIDVAPLVIAVATTKDTIVLTLSFINSQQISYVMRVWGNFDIDIDIDIDNLFPV